MQQLRRHRRVRFPTAMSQPTRKIKPGRNFAPNAFSPVGNSG
jgi:hypothetical protein